MAALDSATARTAALAQHESNPFLVLLTIDHESLSDPIRVVSNNEQITSRGHVYLAYPFQIELPTDSDEAPRARISIANVSRRIGKAIEGMVTSPTALIEIVLASALDDVERSWDQFELAQVSWNAFAMTATLQHRHYWDEPWPKKRITPSKYPGLFP